ncbi:MAG: inositol-3-phosphate synthase [Candidatus Rokubacteria bacterium]|nr:inositol-3-phosphate synthase [Candidatus Rokubacteria bacterium]
MERIGVWLIGARGALASTAIVGARAISHGLARHGGLVTELPEIAALKLVGLDRMVFGGWDVAGGKLLHKARAMAVDDRAVPAGLVAALEDDLLAVDNHIKPGFVDTAGSGRGAARQGKPRKEPLEAVVARLGDDLEQFRLEQRLRRVIVVNVASTEPPCARVPEHDTLDGVRRLIQNDRRAAVTPSMLYAYAALERGCPYVNFTPSTGATPAGVQELGWKHAMPFYGNDGKTGETLMKSVLAPLFRMRNLEVLSWAGFNILGGGDGENLSNPRQRESKLRSKAGVLGPTLGYAPHSSVSIDYVPSLGSWKTAWDHIHFSGFLGTKMSVQFIWQGCDAILAAPLALDLVRLTDFAHEKGERGPMTHLACFFKDPIGVSVHSFTDQFRLLLDYVEEHAGAERQGRRR